MYRIKHKASGLYYSPRPSKLTKKGKVYMGGPDALTYYPFSISIELSKAIMKEFGHLFDIKPNRYGEATVRISSDQFEREPIK